METASNEMTEEPVKEKHIALSCPYGGFGGARKIAVWAVLLAGAALCGLIMGYGWEFDAGSRQRIQKGPEPNRDRKESELAAAHQELRRRIRQRIASEYGGPGHIVWDDVAHEGRLGWYRFEGRLELIHKGNSSGRIAYQAVLHLDGGDEWHLEELTLEREP